MDSKLSSDWESITGATKISSHLPLIEQGLHYFCQGRHLEGISFLARAREGLSPEQTQFSTIIEAFLESFGLYRQAQDTFHQASRRFVEAENGLQALLLTLEKLLLSSIEKNISVSSQSFTSVNASNNYQGPLTVNSTQSRVVNGNGYQSPQSLQSLPKGREDHDTPLELSMILFGCFQVRRQGQPVMLCQNRNGQAILRYLAAQPGYRATTDTLMTLLWPEDEAEVARHKLQVAVSALRHSLNEGVSRPPAEGYILHKNGAYQLNSAVSLTSDVEQFLALYQRGRHSSGEEAITPYEQACQLYTGPFLVEDLYADWSAAQRVYLCQCFLTMCRALAVHYLDTGRYEEAERWGRATLHENRCDEEAHRVLIRIYLAQGRRSEAIRQYQTCERILAEELGVSPMTETGMIGQSILVYEHRAKIERI